MEQVEDIRDEAAARIAVYQEFAPQDMSPEQIKEVIRMTQVAQLLLEEGREEERLQE